ncbi:MAG: 2-oxoacid:ferredoxin oxidoreductase subunit gamma [Planctomycetes bacterium]|nr:2-oxoacid:ferredoxin oxidoreductase subunit gamma [Planctomycetota bacterium]
MTERAILAGWGGQGMMTLGKLLAWTLMQEGKEVTYFPSYGAEVRGGTAHCHVVLSDRPIHSPIVESADTLIVMNQPSYERFRPSLRPGGLLVLNRSLIEVRSEEGVDLLAVPASEIADELGNIRVANTVMLGAYNQVRGLTTAEKLQAALDRQLSGSKAALLDVNRRALAQGAEFARTRHPNPSPAV